MGTRQKCRYTEEQVVEILNELQACPLISLPIAERGEDAVDGLGAMTELSGTVRNSVKSNLP
jgi:hypothetical protein